jgi:hypothetical protein
MLEDVQVGVALLQLIEEALCDLFRRFQVDLLTP